MKKRAFILLILFALLLILNPAEIIYFIAGKINSPSPWWEYGIFTAAILLYATIIYLYLHLFCRFQYRLTLLVQEKYPEQTKNAPKPTMPKRSTLYCITIGLLLFISVFGFVRIKSKLLEKTATQNWQQTVSLCLTCGCRETIPSIYSTTMAVHIPVEQRANILQRLLRHTDIQQEYAYLAYIVRQCANTPQSRALLPVFNDFGISFNQTTYRAQTSTPPTKPAQPSAAN